MNLNNAALKIQRVFRGFLYRVSEKNALKEQKAALTIQRAFRNYRIKTMFKHLKEIIAAKVIKRFIAKYVELASARENFNKLNVFDPILSFYPTVCRPIYNKSQKRAATKSDDYETTTISRKKRAVRMKRTVLISLPPPWHNKNEKRLNRSQKDEMEFNQANDVAWVQNDVMTFFQAHWSRALDKIDDIIRENDRFMSALVTKTFITCVQRAYVSTDVINPTQLSSSGPGVFILGNKSQYNIIEVSTFSNSYATRTRTIPQTAVYDTIIHPKSGMVFSIDTEWRLINADTIMSIQLHVERPYPSKRSFMHIDRAGYLWINLCPQHGPLICVDTLTFEQVKTYSYEQLYFKYRFLKTGSDIIPLYCNGIQKGFCANSPPDEVFYVFDSSFTKCKSFKTDGVPRFFHCDSRLIAFTKEGYIYYVDLSKSSMDASSFRTESRPVSVCCIQDTDYLVVSCQDSVNRIYLLKDIKHPSRITSELDEIADSVLGPVRFTQSRRMFTEIGTYHAYSPFTCMSMFRVSPKLVCVSGAFSNGVIGSFWISSDGYHVPRKEFDAVLSPPKPMNVSSEFQMNSVSLEEKRNRAVDSMFFISTFATRQFDSDRKRFESIVACSPFSDIFTYLPEKQPRKITANEAFFYLYTLKMLPSRLQSFNRFTNEFGLYYGTNELIGVTNTLEPISNLRVLLPKVKLSDLKVKTNSTKQRWFVEYQTASIMERLDLLTRLENSLKQEILSRLQVDIRNSFYSNLIDRKVGIPPINMKAPQKDVKGIKFTKYPNRNLLLVENAHKSFYTSKATDVQYSSKYKSFKVPITEHFHQVQFFSQVWEYSSTKIYKPDKDGRVIVKEDLEALPLSHYLTVHSFLGGSPKLIAAAKSILSNILTMMFQLHSKGIIIRTITPENLVINSMKNTVSLGSIGDIQFLNSESNVPLPEHFCNPSNPFLPPEFYSSTQDKFSKAFDVWQFGVLLLYIITGFLPKSYGLDLESNTQFYDWLSGAPVVGPNERYIGEHGECFIQTSDADTKASVLNLSKYKLTNSKYDSFLTIVANCLQTDPEKRPTVEQLLRTATFYQNKAPISCYSKMSDPNVFAAQFFLPVLSSFSYGLALLEALIFHDYPVQSDAAYSFPLESKAADDVISVLFDMNYLGFFVKRALESNEFLNELIQFYNRFIRTIEKGGTSLLLYANDVVLSLFSLYANNEFLPLQTSEIVSSRKILSMYSSSDSASLFCSLHQKLKPLVKHVIERSNQIYNSLKRTKERTSVYFEQFIQFSELVYTLSSSLMTQFDKQRGTALKMLLHFWMNNQTTSVMKLFLDFKIIHKVFCCYGFTSAESRYSATQMLCEMVKTNYIVFNLGHPVTHLVSSLKSTTGNQGVKKWAFELFRMILSSDYKPAIRDFFCSDGYGTLQDLSNEPSARGIIENCVSPYAARIMNTSTKPKPITMKYMTTEDTVAIAKRIASASEPTSEHIEFFQRILNLFLKKADKPLQEQKQWMIELCNTAVTIFSNICEAITDQIADTILTLFTIPLTSNFYLHNAIDQMVAIGVKHNTSLCRAQDSFVDVLKRDMDFIIRSIDMNSVDIYRYAQDRRSRIKLVNAFISSKMTQNRDFVSFIINNMLHNQAEFKGSFNYRFPIRYEAVSMITPSMIAELESSHVIEKERAMIESNDSYFLVQSSMKFLGKLVNYDGHFNGASILLESLKSRFTRKLEKITYIGKPDTPSESSRQRNEVWRRPQSELTPRERLLSRKASMVITHPLSTNISTNRL